VIRLASAAVLIAVVLTSIWVLPPWTTAMLAAVVAAMAGGEVARLARHIGGNVPVLFVSIAAGIITLSFVIPWTDADPSGAGSLTAVLLALPVASGVLTLVSGPPDAHAFLRAAVMTMAPLYVGLPLGALTWIHWTNGPAVTTWLLATVVISDSAQYYSGRAFGRHRLSPIVSPGKTVEGAVGGLVAAAIAGFALGPRALPGLAPAVGSAVGLGIAAVGLIGDLFESALKRAAGVKDSSTILPGHGGVLDRIDAYLFAAPVFYLALRYVV
jgi:phosphatidate cytidylyltransferase